MLIFLFKADVDGASPLQRQDLQLQAGGGTGVWARAGIPDAIKTHASSKPLMPILRILICTYLVQYVQTKYK